MNNRIKSFAVDGMKFCAGCCGVWLYLELGESLCRAWGVG